MTTLPKSRLSEEEDLRIERAAESKSELWDGGMYSMAGTSRNHALISWNLGASLHAQFRDRSCDAFQNDMRVRVADSGLCTYPDIVAVCGEARYLDDEQDTLLNPQLIVEILSPTKAVYGHGEKFRRYRQIASLTDYLLVAQNRPLVEHWSWDAAVPHAWAIADYSQMSDRIHLASLDAHLALADIYAKVQFTAENPSPAR
jgi:Uma2 family endonuclease